MVWHSFAATTIRDARLIWSIHSDYSEPCRGQLRKTCKGKEYLERSTFESALATLWFFLLLLLLRHWCRYGMALLLSCNQMLMQSAFEMQLIAIGYTMMVFLGAGAIKLVWILFVGHHLMEVLPRIEKHSFGLWLANGISHHSVVLVRRCWWMQLKSGECIRIVRVAMRKYLPTYLAKYVRYQRIASLLMNVCRCLALVVAAITIDGRR